MSRLLLYQPRKLGFKPYTAGILEYFKKCDGLKYKDSEEVITQSLTCQRIDIAEKLFVYYGSDDAIEFSEVCDMIGQHLDINKYPTHLVKRMQTSKRFLKEIVYASMRRYIDTLYFCVTLGYNYIELLKHHHSEGTPVMISTIRKLVEYRNAGPITEYRVNRYNNIMLRRNIELVYDKQTAEKIYKYLISP